jgi:uncharacterized protein
VKTGYADSPLHNGRAPRWLFEKMVLLAREIVLAVAADQGSHEVIRRLSDPVWFQAFGCALGFDWHSSGLTTTVCGALKEATKDIGDDVGLVVAGGKGRASRRTPEEIRLACERLGLDPDPLSEASRLSAKVDSSAVQDGFQLYHHAFMFTAGGAWAVVQQGMNDGTGMARRYHWLTPGRFDRDPHAAVAGNKAAGGSILNLVASESESNRTTSVALAREGPDAVLGELQLMRRLSMPRHHEVWLSELHPERLERVLLAAYEAQPADYTALLSVPGVGAKGLRALSLVAELTYGDPASVRDPVSYSFAHGGKDGHPFPVDRATYDSTIESLRSAVREAAAGRAEKVGALKRLARLSANRESELEPVPRLPPPQPPEPTHFVTRMQLPPSPRSPPGAPSSLPPAPRPPPVQPVQRAPSVQPAQSLQPAQLARPAQLVMPLPLPLPLPPATRPGDPPQPGARPPPEVGSGRGS